MKSYIKNKTIQKLICKADKDGIQKIVVRAVIKRRNKFLLLERAPNDFLGGLVVLPGGSISANEDILQALVREIKEESGLTTVSINNYLGFSDYISSSGKKTRQFVFTAKTKPGDVKLDSEHSRFFFLSPLDKSFSTLNISAETKRFCQK